MKKLRKGDTVIILTGENKTKKGIIYKIYNKTNKALLQNGNGSGYAKEILINISNISFLKQVKLTKKVKNKEFPKKLERLLINFFKK
ncbi:KOW motif-containing protein [Candidatus Karelsulcia muelleri]|uniref:KOW motif-containing protein n=1 Tax=Candidatus Karelsulcia muelleri TaxID=336810 RepID=UPI000D7C7463|nr:KOW motif-containing protein [Candidatus Karelsulcia muelleri]